MPRYPCNPIGVDLFAMCDERYRTGVCEIGKSSVGNLLTLSFFLEDQKPSHPL